MINPSVSIIAVLDRKLRLCDDLLSVTLLLKAALDREDADGVSLLIIKREALISAINGLDRQILILRSRKAPDNRSASILQIKNMAGEICKKLRNIDEVNKFCEAGAFLRCEVLRNELMMLRHKEAGLQGYAMKEQRVSKFLSLQT